MQSSGPQPMGQKPEARKGSRCLSARIFADDFPCKTTATPCADIGVVERTVLKALRITRNEAKIFSAKIHSFPVTRGPHTQEAKMTLLLM